MEKFFKKAREIKLSPEDKNRVRANLISFMEANPVKAPVTARRLTLILRPVAATLMAIVLLGGGTSFAAQKALPGDLLYPVKVGVNEEVKGWFAVSEEAKAKLNASLAEKRLEEVEQLAAEGRLDAEASAEIETRLEKHAQVFKENAGEIGKNDGVEARAEAYSNFEASLKAHERILSQISREKAEVEIKPILAKVRSLTGQVVKSRTDVEASASSKSNTEVEVAAEGRMKAAENKIAEVKSFIGRVEGSLSAAASTEAQAKLESADSAFKRGEEQIKSENYNEAFASFQEAARIAQEAKLVTAASEKLGIDVTVPGMDVEDNGGEGSDNNDNDGEGHKGSIKVEGSNSIDLDIGL